MKRISVFLVAFFSIITLSGCVADYASVDDEKFAKTFRIKDPKTSQIYIYRPKHYYGSWMKKRVWVDGKFAADLTNETFFVAVVKPGQHIVSTRSEFGNNHITFKTKPGRNYYVKQNIKYGVFSSGSGIRLMSYKVAMKDILNCDLVEGFDDDEKDIDKEDFNNLKKEMYSKKK